MKSSWYILYAYSSILELRGNMPIYMHISDGKMHDMNALDLLMPETGSFYIMDRGYLDFKRLYRWRVFCD